MMTEADDSLSVDSTDVGAAIQLAYVNRVFSPLIKSEISTVLQKHHQDLELKELLKKASAIDRVNVKLKQRKGQQLAVVALQKFLKRNQGTDVFDYVVENHEELVGEPVDEAFLEELEGGESAGSKSPSATSDARPEAGASPTPREPKAAGLGMRTWKTRDGKHEIEAEFVKLIGEKVRLRKKSGKTTTIAVKLLSDSDQKLLAN